MFILKYIKEVYSGLKSLAVGLRRTLYYFSHHKEIITQQYPDNRDTLVFPDRFKGEVIMLHDDNNEHACTGCTACELACVDVPLCWSRCDIPDSFRVRASFLLRLGNQRMNETPS